MEPVEDMKAQSTLQVETNKISWGNAATPGPCSTDGPSTLSKYGKGAGAAYEGLAVAIAAELMIGFWFGIGAILASKMVNSLEELISRK